MISYLYYDIYLLVVSILSFSLFNKYRKGYSSVLNNNKKAFALMLFMIAFIGLRPSSGAFVDMTSYERYYNMLLGNVFEFDKDAENLIFDNMMPFMASLNIPVTIFFVLMATMYFGFMYIACRRLFKNDVYAAYLVCLGAFSTFSYCTNGMKAGVAASIFLFAISYIDKLWVCIPLALVSKGFHHSMTLPIVAFLCALIYNKPRFYLYLWLFCLLMAIGYIESFADFFAGLTDERGAEYLIGEKVTHIGFRLDFILYSAMPVWLGWRYLRINPNPSRTYRILLCTYMLANSIWMLCMYANFNNRIAYLSWFMYPIVLIYPILKDNWAGANRYSFFAKVGSYHLGFTLFMQIVYYGIFSLGN